MFLQFIVITLLLWRTIIAFHLNNPHASKLQIDKCCPFGQYVKVWTTCGPFNGKFDFSSAKVYDEDVRDTGKNLEDLFTLIPNKFEDEDFALEAFDATALNYSTYLIENGNLMLELPNTYDRWQTISPGNFCVDFGNTMKPQFWPIRSRNNDSNSNSYEYILTGTLISFIFMLLVMVVYSLLPGPRSLYEMILMAYIASLSMAFLLVAVMQIIDNSANNCIGFTYGLYFFFLSAFCWMTVTSFNIWRGFSNVENRPTNDRKENLCRFRKYCFYAWGVPLVMTAGFVALNSAKGALRGIPWFVTPHIPEYGCFLQGGEKLLYLYCPMLILIIINWIFYGLTACSIFLSNRTMNRIVLNASHANNQKARRTQRGWFMVYLRLSLVMGLIWLFEIISFLYPDFVLWYVSDTFNILIGVTLFLITVCKRKIWKRLRLRFSRKNKPNQESVTLKSSKSDRSSHTQSFN